MAKKADVRTKITFECTECKHRNYDSYKNKRNDNAIVYFPSAKVEAIVVVFSLLASFTGVLKVKVYTECKHRNYDSYKNKRNDPDRLTISKYCPFCKKHTEHKESK